MLQGGTQNARDAHRTKDSAREDQGENLIGGLELTMAQSSGRVGLEGSGMVKLNLGEW